jgi:hypothetical protein
MATCRWPGGCTGDALEEDLYCAIHSYRSPDQSQYTDLLIYRYPSRPDVFERSGDVADVGNSEDIATDSGWE